MHLLVSVVHTITISEAWGGPLSRSGLENEAYLQGGSIMGHIIDNISYDHIHYANTQLV